MWPTHLPPLPSLFRRRFTPPTPRPPSKRDPLPPQQRWATPRIHPLTLEIYVIGRKCKNIERTSIFRIRVKFILQLKWVFQLCTVSIIDLLADQSSDTWMWTTNNNGAQICMKTYLGRVGIADSLVRVSAISITRLFLHFLHTILSLYRGLFCWCYFYLIAYIWPAVVK